MPIKKLRLIFTSLVICFLSYSCNSVRDDEAATLAKLDNSVAVSSEAKKQVVGESNTDKNKLPLNEAGEIKQDIANISSNTNQFNRLLKNKKRQKKKSIKTDNIHDYSNPGVRVLQNPHEAFSGLPKAKGGNAVDWIKAQDMGKIKPYSDLYDPEATPLVMDMNIVREVKGTMPDVVFPHKQHTQVLDCTNCHPEIFIPQKGANQMSMAVNLMGEKCGVCHGKVAFPLSRCTSCHSKKKPQQELKKTKWKWP